MRLDIPEFSMVALIGTSGSGKSTFARRHFLPTEVLSSDYFRGLVSDDENSQEASRHAFEALHFLLSKRLELGRLTVVDATNVQREARAPLLKLASRWHALKVAIVLDVPEHVCHTRNADRPDRQFGPHVVKAQRNDLRRTRGELRKEGWHKIYFLNSEEIEAVEIHRGRIWSRRPEEHGPFDIIGDVHGCIDELNELLHKLGWQTEPQLHHPEGRKLVFVGDLVDRGPDSLATLQLAMNAVKTGVGLWVPGNHDIKLTKALSGRPVSVGHGLAETLAQLESASPEFKRDAVDLIQDLVSHLVLDDGKLCVAHAGLPEEMQGRGSKAVREFCLYGETTGEIDEFGLPVRYPWAKSYRGKTSVVYGHTPVPTADWFNNTLNIDTGCCFGGALTALRYPERQIVQVSARRVYAEPIRPMLANQISSLESDVLELKDVIGRRTIETELMGRIIIREENAIAALEVMSRFATDPRWLIYLPPTMSPCATSKLDGFLEYPTEAFSFYAGAGVTQVICQEKHMGSRALAVICANAKTAEKRFGISTGEQGVIVTRTGRRFFENLKEEQALVSRLASALTRSGVFGELASDWVLLDLELMPWSAKAVGLLRDQYAPVGVASNTAAQLWSEVTAAAERRGVEGSAELRALAGTKQQAANLFREAYRRHCWTVHSLDDLKLAPFHLLASEGAVHTDKSHDWHLATLARVCDEDPPLLRKTANLRVDVEDPESVAAACAWWEAMVTTGGEGMVVKPLDFVVREGDRVLQPAVKVRGPEYLRIIYGPEYLLPQNLERLRQRGLNRKRSLAAKEFALGIEALSRFVRFDPLTHVHECVFGVLALESEPVDPRL